MRTHKYPLGTVVWLKQSLHKIDAHIAQHKGLDSKGVPVYSVWWQNQQHTISEDYLYRPDSLDLTQ